MTNYLNVTGLYMDALTTSICLCRPGMMVDRGQLVGLTADCGHYWPQPGHFRWFYDQLQRQGADLSALKGLDFSTKH